MSRKSISVASKATMTYVKQCHMPLGWKRGSVLCLLVLALLSCDSGSTDTTPPSPPSGLEATSQDGAIALNWNAVQSDDFESYSVYRSRSSGDLKSGSALERGISSENYVDESVSNGTAYYYVVTATDQAGNESEPSSEIEKAPFAEPPNRP